MVRAFSLIFAAVLCSPLWAAPEALTYRVLETLPHDSSLFTQGLVTDRQWIYESGGGWGRSQLLRYHKETGAVDARFQFSKKHFAEGLTLFRDRLYLLTWKAGVLLIYEPQTPHPIRRIRYRGEGWGLTHNGESLIMSDGSDQLYFRSATDFAIQRAITVHDEKRRWRELNELEFADGTLWANVWGDNRILAIDPADGRVRGVVDFTALRNRTVQANAANVLNGIAYDPQRRAFWITGKNWPQRYLVEISSAPSSSPLIDY